MEAPIEPDPKPDRSIQNICERSPALQTAILSKLKLNRCSSVDGQELFRIEAISVAGDLKAGDLVNLKRLNLVTEGDPPPPGIFANLGNLEALEINVKTDETSS